MEPTRTDSALSGDTLTAYEFAMAEVRVASSNLARALLARALSRNHSAKLEREALSVYDGMIKEYSEARSVYDKMIGLYPRVRLAAAQRDSLLEELALLRSRLEECED